MQNKKGTEIKVGQVWQDMDGRTWLRKVEVIRLDEARRKVQVSHAGRKTWISADRMHPHSTGFTLVTDVAAD